ncbi:hypothetical protein ACHAXH_003405 [Discostella pseudostelligera]|jgi:hypothetical protein
MSRWSYYHNITIFICGLFLLEIVPHVFSFQGDRSAALVRHAQKRIFVSAVAATSDNGKGGDGSDVRLGSNVDEYRNAPTAILSNFLQSSSDSSTAVKTTTIDPLADIDFNAPKQSPKLSLETLAAVLDYELYEKEWFVTGQINPIYFDDTFQFQDPDVKLTGVEEYARGVLKLFDQSSSRAQIISCEVNTTIPNTITVTWRLSGRVNIGPKGLPIKPYICYTDFTIDEDNGLIVFQEDRFDIPGWDILLSALFPFLIGKVTKEPAPEVEPRVVTMPTIAVRNAKNDDIFGGIFRMLKS